FDEPVIRGRDLFIPSSGERISSFSVSDDPGQPPLTPGPNYQGKGGDDIPIHMLPGPDRQLWIATVALARLRLTTDALQPDSDPVANGVSTQPLVYEAGYLFNARQRPYSNAVVLTRTDRDELTSDWQAVLGSAPLAFANAGDMMVSVNDAGVVFRVGDRQWGEKFYSTAASRLPVHEELVTPLAAAAVGGNRLAIVCGNPEPRCWIVGPSGQIEGSPQLPDVPEAAPVMIGDRLVVPMAGRLKAIKLSPQSTIQDFVLPTGETHRWKDVKSSGSDRAIAVTEDGIVMQIRLLSSPKTNLAEAGRIELGASVMLPLGASEKFVAVVDSSQRVTVLNADLFERVGTRIFELAPTSAPVVVGSHVLVETGLAELHSLNADEGLTSRWTMPLNGSPLIGGLETPAGLVLAQQNGTVSVVNPENGEVKFRMSAGRMLAMGPFVTSRGVFVATIDNTLVPIQLP
ncbi:MAG: hypothetical protein KDA88_20385, partial [Planctomycetaceae bacterium]|nr:hypothetical protein [Planctomycetaceae bacterium]